MLLSNRPRCETVPIKADVTRTQDISRAVKEVKTSVRAGFDILVNNAGDISRGGIALKSFDLSDEDWKFSLDTNFMSAVGFTRRGASHSCGRPPAGRS